MAGLTGALRARFLRFRKEILVVAFAVRDPRTPWHLRLAGVGFLLYLASPLDLVPLFIPILGILDDLLIVPWGLSRVVGRLPERPRAEAEAAAEAFIRRYVARPLLFFVLLLTLLMVLWALLLGLLWWVVLQ
jgi:uncharacterized membrane protein YkvA (DUF1232 family)